MGQLRHMCVDQLSFMKTTNLLVCLALLLLCGCSHQYVIKLSNGTKITTVGKPKLDKGYYVYKDAHGDKHAVAQGRVVEIDNASIAEDERSKFIQPTSQKK